MTTTENGVYTAVDLCDKIIPPMELPEAIEDVKVVLIKSISAIKSRNQANGYQIGIGRKVREPWEHLQYALDRLYWKAGVYNVLVAIRCLQHSGVTYEFQPIPWNEIHQNFPAPARRMAR